MDLTHPPLSSVVVPTELDAVSADPIGGNPTDRDAESTAARSTIRQASLARVAVAPHNPTRRPTMIRDGGWEAKSPGPKKAV